MNQTIRNNGIKQSFFSLLFFWSDSLFCWEYSERTQTLRLDMKVMFTKTQECSAMAAFVVKGYSSPIKDGFITKPYHSLYSFRSQRNTVDWHG